MIRTFLAAALTALALASAGVGTASAAEPRLALEICTPVQIANNDTAGCTTAPASTTPTTTTSAPSSPTYNTCAEYNSHGIYDIRRGDPRYRESLDRDRDGRACERNEGNVGGPRGHWDGRNRFIDWDNGQRGDFCFGRDYNEWVGHYSVYRGEINRYGINSTRWLDLRKANKCSPDVIVTNDGDCVTFRNVNRDYGTRYNSRVRQLVDQARDPRSPGGRDITRDERDRIDNAADLRDFLDRYNTSRNQLRTICKDDTPEVIVTPAPDVIVNPAPTTVVQAPPSVVTVPQGPAETGDGSTE